MNKLYIPWWFDVLHGNHKKFISEGINNSWAKEVFIWLATDSKLASKKWKERPFFSYEWRSLDLKEFFLQNFPHIDLNIIPTDQNHEVIKNMHDSVKVLTINPEYTKIKLPNAWIMPSSESAWQHTSDIPFMLNNIQNLSWCIVRKVGAVLVREGFPIVASANDMFHNSNCISCSKYHAWVTWWKECWKYVKCSHDTEHAERLVLEQSNEWDDIFVTHAPCDTYANEIIKKKIRRVVYLQEYSNMAGVRILEKKGIGVRQAWFHA